MSWLTFLPECYLGNICMNSEDISGFLPTMEDIVLLRPRRDAAGLNITMNM